MTCPSLLCYKNSYNFNNVKITINQNVNCSSKNVIYIFIRNCGKLYIGKTISEFHLRINLHRQHILSDTYTTQNVSFHIKNCCSILYKCSDKDVRYIEDIENYFIHLINSELNSYDLYTSN